MGWVEGSQLLHCEEGTNIFRRFPKGGQEFLGLVNFVNVPKGSPMIYGRGPEIFRGAGYLTSGQGAGFFFTSLQRADNILRTR